MFIPQRKETSQLRRLQWRFLRYFTNQINSPLFLHLMFTFLYTHIGMYHAHTHTQRERPCVWQYPNTCSGLVGRTQGILIRISSGSAEKKNLSNNHIYKSSHFHSILFQECWNTWQTLIHSHVHTHSPPWEELQLWDVPAQVWSSVIAPRAPVRRPTVLSQSFTYRVMKLLHRGWDDKSP